MNSQKSRTEGAYLEDHGIWPRGRKEATIEELVPQCVLCSNLVAVQLASKARCPAHAITFEHGTEHLAHNLRRQLDSKRTSDAVASEVAIPRLTIHIDRARVREHIGL